MAPTLHALSHSLSLSISLSLLGSLANPLRAFFIGSVARVTCKTFYLTVSLCLLTPLAAEAGARAGSLVFWLSTSVLTFSLIAHLPFTVIRLKMRQVSHTDPLPASSAGLSHCELHFQCTKVRAGS